MHEKIKRVKKYIYQNVDLTDVFVFGGLAALCYGVAQIHAPSAWIVAGASLIWLGKYQ
jgi:hypothetical protein